MQPEQECFPVSPLGARHAGQWLSQKLGDGSRVRALRVALMELIVNLVEHAEPVPAECSLTLQHEGAWVELTLQVRHSSFPTVQAFQAAICPPDDPLSLTGRGLFYAAQACDVLEYSPADAQGWESYRLRQELADPKP